MASQGPNAHGALGALNEFADVGAGSYQSTIPEDPFGGGVVRVGTTWAGKTYGFTIPAGSTIDGIVVTFNASVSGAGDSPAISAYLASNDGGGTQYTSGSASGSLTTTPTAFSFGSSTDKWNSGGSTPTDSVVNGTNFSLQLYAEDWAATPNTVSVDTIRMTVYYTLSSGKHRMFQVF